MADSKISELQRLTDLAGRDLLLVIDRPYSNNSSSTNKNITVDEFFDAIPSNTNIYADAYVHGNTSVNTLFIRDNTTPANATITTVKDRSFWSDGSKLYFKPTSSPIMHIPMYKVGKGGPEYTVSTLPAGLLGQTAYVTDGQAALAWGATVTAGGSTKYLVWFNGTNWTIVGK